MVSQVACGSNHTYVLRGDGTVRGWGSNQYGQATTPPSLSSVSQVACGGRHTVVRRTNGTIEG
ncbi:MAG: hypothetical protein ACK55I_34705, partial [bacterium]